jgi:hypothetical protein
MIGHRDPCLRGWILSNLVGCVANNALRVPGVLLTGRRTRERSNLVVVRRLVRANGAIPRREDQCNYLVSRRREGTFTIGVLATMSSMSALRA